MDFNVSKYVEKYSVTKYEVKTIFTVYIKLFKKCKKLIMIEICIFQKIFFLNNSN